MNVALALGALGFARLGVTGGVREALGIVVYANIVLALFNALPGIPMDGGRVLEAVVWGVSGSKRLGAVVAAWGGRVVVAGIVAYLAWLNFGQGREPSLFSIMWGFLLVSFLWPASTAALRQAGVQERVDAVTIVRLMRPAIGLRYDATVAAALAEARKAGAEEVIVLSVDGRPAGHFATSGAAEVPAERREATALGAVTVPLPRGAEVSSDLAGRAVLESIRAWWGKTDAIAVMDEGEVVGVVRLSEVGERLK
jgi:hypothetical protein